MDVREIKTYDLCRYGKKVWLRKFNSASGLYDVVISTDKRFETRGNLLYFEEGGLFWLSSDKNELLLIGRLRAYFVFMVLWGKSLCFQKEKRFLPLNLTNRSPEK